MTDTENWMERVPFAERAAHKALAAAMFERNKAAIMPHLPQRGSQWSSLPMTAWATAAASSEPDYFGIDNQPLAAPEIDLEVEEIRRDTCALVGATKPICEALTDLAYEALAVHHPGWENNEGAVRHLPHRRRREHDDAGLQLADRPNISKTRLREKV